MAFAMILLLPLLAAAAADEAVYPMALTIDDRPDVQVIHGREIRRALAACHPPASCKDVELHREPQIDYGANFDRRGYTISHRLGPPGPEMNARRKGKGDRTHFTTAEMITITADYLDGRDTPFVRWKEEDLFPR